MAQPAGSSGQFGGLFRELSGTDIQLLVSAAVVGATALLIYVVAPAVVRQIRRTAGKRYFGGGLADFAVRINDRFPVTTPMRFALKLLQIVAAMIAFVALLEIWGYYWLAVSVVSNLPLTWADVGRALGTVLLGIAAYVGMGLLEETIESFSEETNRMTAHQEQIVVRVLQLSLLVFAALVALGLWNANPRGLLAGAGFLGIVVGLAARQTLGSLIAGFVLMFSRPFEIGDWVEIGEEEGVVTDITIVNTRLENFDGEFVVIPNDRVADRAITNRSQKGRLRLRVDVGIDYEADPDHATEVAEDAIEEVEFVEATPSPQAFPKEFGDSAIVLELRFWIDHPSPPKRWRAHAGVVNAVKDAYDREGIEIPFPQRTVSDRTGPAEARRHGTERAELGADASPEGAAGDGQS